MFSCSHAHAELEPQLSDRVQAVIDARDTRLRDARTSLLSALDSSLARFLDEDQTTNEIGVNALSALRFERNQFHEEGILPTSPPNKAAADKFKLATDDADSKFDSDIRSIVHEHRDKGRLKAAFEILEMVHIYTYNDLSKAADAFNSDLSGTTWDFLNSSRRKITTLTFKADGTVDAEDHYENATWKQLDEHTILFSYGVRSCYVVFRVRTVNLMTGYNSVAGNERHLRRVQPTE
jgi:hypothetical protein